MKRCFHCFREYDAGYNVCPHCGQAEVTRPVEPIQLAPGTVLGNRYILGLCVGAGGFGIVYKAWDAKLESIVAVKEFFVSRMMTRAEGQKDVIVSKKSQAEFEYRKDRFLAEARNMAKFGSHRSIPNVFEFFEENNTAYIVMELLVGSSLNNYMHEHGGRISPDFAILIANDVGNALKSFHEQKIIHRDVAPDNIFICASRDIKIKLMDLGAAKLADSSDDVIDIILKPGYSPAEQYDKGDNIGPWSDIYAMGATLYAMLTGTKPDESTNRKIKDEVVPPHILNPEVSENLSHTIMKAMAIEKHMRFKNMDEFLAAINGEKKVIPLEKERKKRRRRRLSGIIVALLVVLAISGLVFKTYTDKKKEQELEDASITIWFSLAEGSNEETAVNSVVSKFRSKFKNVEIDVKAIPEAEYADAIAAAAKEGKLPTLFESTDISDEILKDATDLKNVISSDQFKSCLFLDQYEDYYDTQKRMPLAIEVPVACIIKEGATTVDYDQKLFKELSDFGKDVNIAIDSEHEDLVGKNFGTKGFCSDEEFFDFTENTSPVLLSSTMQINTVRSMLTAYTKDYVYSDADKVYCNFIYEWSIGDGSENEIRAAERLLSWMLGNEYQQILMIRECQDGQIPVNKTGFEAKMDTTSLEPIKNTHEKFVFKGE